ncbi:MAG: dTDP-4-dehydrorhamnose 3,5-epimerase [Desulfobacterales bacterium]
MQISKTKIPGCFKMSLHKMEDNRGVFVKTFHEDYFREFELETNFVEEYYSYSVEGVIRGLHFQIPPTAHTKLVYCAYGEVFDAVVDLRIGSPTYKCFEVVELSSKKGNLLYIPPGLAHGFVVLSKEAVVVYNATSVYSAEHDKGILWNSAGIPWPNKKPIISERDKMFKSLNEFDSPFIFKSGSKTG